MHIEPHTPQNDPQNLPAWLLGPADLAAIAATDGLGRRLVAGEAPDPADPLAVTLAGFLSWSRLGGGAR